MPAAAVELRCVDSVAIVTIDDGKANAMGHGLLDELEAALEQANRSAGAVVLAGRPGMFCAGLDLAVVRGGSAGEVADLMAAATRFYEVLLRHPQAVVAACTGHALAGGALILLCADARVGARGEYVVGITEVAIGIALPRFGYTLAEQRLDRRFLVRATVLAERFDPDAAVEAGFLDDLADDPVEAAVVRAGELATLDAAALVATRSRVYASLLAATA